MSAAVPSHKKKPEHDRQPFLLQACKSCTKRNEALWRPALHWQLVSQLVTDIIFYFHEEDLRQREGAKVHFPALSRGPNTLFDSIEWSDQLLQETSGVDQWNCVPLGYTGLPHWFPVTTDRIVRLTLKVDRAFKVWRRLCMHAVAIWLSWCFAAQMIIMVGVI